MNENALGNYRFVPIDGRPFSASVLVDPQFDLVHVTFHTPVPLDAGLEEATRLIRAAGRSVQALAGVELRIPEQLSDEAFARFNSIYESKLKAIGLEVAGRFPAGRTNVVALAGGVAEPSIHGFAYTAPGMRTRPAFLVSGVAETVEGSSQARLASILDGIDRRLEEIGRAWEEVTTIQLYGAGELDGSMVRAVLERTAGSAMQGVRCFPALPPTRSLTLEVDVRSAGTELIVF